MENSYDILIVGGGPAGCRAAVHGAKLGLRCALFEQHALGGVCLNTGCIPTKTLLHAARMLNRLREDAGLFGIHVAALTIEPQELWQRKDRIVARLRAALEVKLERMGIDVIMEHAEYAASDTESVRLFAGGKLYTGKHLLAATGSIVVASDIPGVSPDVLLATPQIPSRLLIIGGGAVGMEFAAIYQALGSDVAVVEAMAEIGGNIPDSRAAELLRETYIRRGVKFFLNNRVVSVSPQGAVLRDGTVLPPSTILHACGRKSDTAFARVPNAIRIGDTAGGEMLAHVAEFEAEQAINRIAGQPVREQPPIPHVIYTDPEIAWVGELTGNCVTVPFSACGRYAVENPKRNGFCTIARNNDGYLAGALIAGEMAAELIGYFNVGAPIENSHFFPHPAFCEIMNRLMDDQQS